MNITMLPLLFTALLIWTGILTFLLGLERRVSHLEKQIELDEKRWTGSDR